MVRVLQCVALAGCWRVVRVTTRLVKRVPMVGLRPGRCASFCSPATPSARKRLRQRETFFGVMAMTAAITCNSGTPLSEVADTTIVVEVGPEVVSGSTRMKSATAQKMICNMITTGAMTRLGYVYDNLMVNVHMKNAKLVERGIRVLMKVCNIDRDAAIRTIKSAGKSIPIAVVMLKADVDKMEAVRRLAKSDGNVRLAIDDSRLEL